MQPQLTMDLFPFDDEYVRRLKEGDRWTEEHFYSYFQRLLLIKLRPRLNSMQAIDDVRQETYVRVFKNLRSPGGGIHDGRKFGAYVNGICNNVLLERYRRPDKTEPLQETHLQLPALDDAEADLLKHENKEQVRLVLDKLPKRDIQILLALFYEDRKPGEVALSLRVDRGYLRVLLHRARGKLRSNLGKLGHFDRLP